MADRSSNLHSLFHAAETLRTALEATSQTARPMLQEKVAAAIAKYEQCQELVNQLALFSRNEDTDDISSGDLRYLLIEYHLATLILRDSSGERTSVLLRGREAYKQYLDRLDAYRLLSVSDQQQYERYLQSPDTFSTASTTDASARRNTKIARFREERELKKKLAFLQQNPTALQNDDGALRDLHLSSVRLATHETFSSLESIAQELDILAMAPSIPRPGSESLDQDNRQRSSHGGRNAYSERLDPPMSQLLVNGGAGPILDQNGRPLKPFTLLNTRERMRNGVFRPGHNLPTMTIDEYLEEEKRRGGIVEGGGEQSGIRPTPDEDDMAKADEETIKAREWDDFTESNPKGAGNTMNRG
ncbi:MAG: hypothetical protein M1838_000505 [Thelocarpon superellum]|nr:MAG: hypothetical protein M1838_000505 [Thelocarpon superellum]